MTVNKSAAAANSCLFNEKKNGQIISFFLRNKW